MTNNLSYWEKKHFFKADVIIVGAGIVGLNAAIAIKEKNQKYFVMTNKKVLKEITIGINDGFFVEVISGLSKGDTIIHE